MSYTVKNLHDVEDAAVKFGFSEHLEARFARNDLEAQKVGLAYQRFHPGKRSAFGHRHGEDEEIYVVLAGSGRMNRNEEIIALKPMDAIRVAPDTMRAFEAGDDGL